jgi:cytochrome b
LDKPPVELIGHRQWRTLTHNPFGLLVLKAMWGDRFKLGEAVSHVLVDDLLPYK